MITTDDLLARMRSALSPAALALFEPILRGTELSEDDGDAVCTFPIDPRAVADGEHDEVDEHNLADRQLRILARARPADALSPATVRALFEVCGGMDMGIQGETGQLVLHDGFRGTLAVVGKDAWNARRSGLAWTEGLCAPIDINLQAYYVVHPESGRLYLCDGLFELVRDTVNPVEVYLREVHLRFKTWREPITPLQRFVAAMPERLSWLGARAE